MNRNNANNEENILETSTDFKRVNKRQSKYGNRTLKKPRKKMIAFSIFLWLILFAVLAAFILYTWQTSPIDKESEEEIIFMINEGESSDEISKTLFEAGLIRNEDFLKLYLKVKKINHVVEGRYKAGKSDSLKEIIEMIKEGRVENDIVIFQILEGKNIRYIAHRVEEEFNISQNTFINLINDSRYIDKLIEKYWFIGSVIKDKKIYYSLEGYLFPDTYHFDKTSTNAELVVETMLNRTEEILEPFKSNYIDSEGEPVQNNSVMPIHQVLTLASITELEGTNKDNRREIIGVFINRLQDKMKLQSDPTTYYAAKIDMSERDLKISELNMDNPYNTYGPKMEGKIPIGPICSPSKESIESTFNYKKTNNYFFVSDKNGKIYFTKTNSEHENKIRELQDAGLWHIHD